MTTLERIEAAAGTVTAYDGKTVVWTSTGVHDVRDVLKTIKGVSLSLAMDALAEADAEASKVRKAAAKAAKESAE